MHLNIQIFIIHNYTLYFNVYVLCKFQYKYTFIYLSSYDLICQTNMKQGFVIFVGQSQNCWKKLDVNFFNICVLIFDIARKRKFTMSLLAELKKQIYRTRQYIVCFHPQRSCTNLTQEQVSFWFLKALASIVYIIYKVFFPTFPAEVLSVCPQITILNRIVNNSTECYI